MLLGLFQEVMQDYRDEIKDFFAVDKQLASELEYDMKKYSEQLAQEQALTEHTNATKVPEDGDRVPSEQVGGGHTSSSVRELCLENCGNPRKAGVPSRCTGRAQQLCHLLRLSESYVLFLPEELIVCQSVSEYSSRSSLGIPSRCAILKTERPACLASVWLSLCIGCRVDCLCTSSKQ